MTSSLTVAHVTHETVQKVGGIGAVLQGFFTSRLYNERVDRSILIGPLFNLQGGPDTRLGPQGQVLYSSVDGILQSPHADALRAVEDKYGCHLVYGRRTFRDAATGVISTPEVLLVDVARMDLSEVNRFKACLFEQFGICSDRYEDVWDYDQYVKLGPVAVDLLAGMGAVDGDKRQCILLAHEFMGMPAAMAAMMRKDLDIRTIFYAHEVATVRPIVEKHPGHDTMFYNVMAMAESAGRSLTDVFGNQDGFFKHALISQARFCDNVFAVGDQVIDELHFLSPEFEKKRKEATSGVDLVYNGIPTHPITFEQRQKSRNHLRNYAEIILGKRPQYLFTHVTRTALSKGLWRDLRVLEELDRAWDGTDNTAVLFILSTDCPPRRLADIERMERDYHWPAAHREGLPDLSEGEAVVYAGVQEFNLRARNIRVILINQFGFDQRVCGRRMPEEIEFMDIRQGTDVEFGQSIYEPFGIAQLEPLAFGALCVVGSVCGCLGFARDVTENKLPENIIVADYTDLTEEEPRHLHDILEMDQDRRNAVERRSADRIAQTIFKRLPRETKAAKALLEEGYRIAKQMSWDRVVTDYFLPGIDNAIRNKKTIKENT